jgi:nucleoside diphosphate kinase
MTTLKEHLLESIKSTAEIFMIIKPGFLSQSQQILEILQKEGWEVKHSRVKRLLLSEAKRLYRIHKGQDFYKDLCEYMSSDISCAYILVNKSKKMSEQTFEEFSQIKQTIREKFGESEMRNVIHSSDSIENMYKEKSVYFAL